MKISEIKFSISGEISMYPQGSPALFIRLAECNLANRPCKFCDTQYALVENYSSGEEQVSNLAQTITNITNKNRVIVITGGEPLLQADEVIQLITELKCKGFEKIVVETNGTYNARKIIPNMYGVCVVADYKPPSSGNNDLMENENFIDLIQGDVLKFPIENENDLNVATEMKNLLEDSGCYCMKAISPVFNNKKIAGEAYELIEKATVNGFIISVQLHKLINVY